jgi:hypothetical protein
MAARAISDRAGAHICKVQFTLKPLSVRASVLSEVQAAANSKKS